MTCHHQEGLMSNLRASVCNCGPEFHLIGHLEYTSKSDTEFQDYFPSLRMIFLSFVISKTCGTVASDENM